MNKGRSWVEINFEQIKKNYLIYKQLLPESLPIMAVVKADAYGHGDVRVASFLQSLGVIDFAVSNVDEAIRLRQAGIEGQILILGYTPLTYMEYLLDYDITQAILSSEYAELIKEYPVKAQFAIDTGMNRIGLDGDDIAGCERTIRAYLKTFQLTGIFSHLCAADNPLEKDFTEKQIAKFEAVSDSIKDLHLPYIHILNSAGGLSCQASGNMVRLGIIMYGLKPDLDFVLPNGIKQALTWKSVVSMVKKIHVGETIGYGRSYTANREMTVATIPTGYADGFSRTLSNHGYVLIGNQKAQIVGRVCMDQMMVDVSAVPNVKMGDEVILMDSHYTADDMARTIGTIGYEVICGISKRVPRFYI